MRLTAENITKSFGAKQVLKGIDLSVESGRALGLLGRNGAGKTTMIRIVMQVFQADSGRVLIDGKPMDVNRVRIGYLPEERGLYPKKLIMEQLLYFAALQGVPARQAKKDALRLLDRLGMSEYANKRLDTLSKGNQQKIQLVATLICDPRRAVFWPRSCERDAAGGSGEGVHPTGEDRVFLQPSDELCGRILQRNCNPQSG